MKFIVYAALLMPLSLANSCATLQSQIHERYCNDNGSYERGINDAISGRNMDSSWVSSCDEQDRLRFCERYQSGFITALPNSPKKVLFPSN